MRPFAEGERIVAIEIATGRRWLVIAQGPHAKKVPGLGIVNGPTLIGKMPGDHVTLGRKLISLQRPTPDDLHRTLRRKAQIIQRKDLGRIIWGLGLQEGCRVLESGVGSAAATIGLAKAVGPTGRVVVQELREDFQEWAQGNLDDAAICNVEIHLGDLTVAAAPGIEGPFDAVLLDQPQAAAAVDNVVPLLAMGARLCLYCPNVVQMEAAVNKLQAHGCTNIDAVEMLERRWDVKEFGSRPATGDFGHTAFLVFGRYIGGKVDIPEEPKIVHEPGVLEPGAAGELLG